MPDPLYPTRLETFWLERAAAALRTRDAETILGDLLGEVSRLGDLFTVERPERFDRYGDVDRAQLAYGLFFFPQTYARTRLVLQECLAAGRWTPPRGRALRILDLGAGLGAGLLAAAHALEGHTLHLCALDHAGGSLGTLQVLFAAEGRTAETRVGHLLQPLPEDERWDLILCSFALNEALQAEPDADVTAWARSLFGSLENGGLLLLIEPALDGATGRLEKLRDALASDGEGRIIAPCPHHAPCPLRREGRYGCHEVRRWKAPDSMLYLNRRLFRDLQVLKYCFLAVTRTARPEAAPDPASCRLVTPVDEQNGKLVARGCAADGELHTYEILNRRLSRAERKQLAETERGSRLRWPALQPLKDGRTLRSDGMPAVE